MKRYRVTILKRDDKGREWASVHGPFDGPGDAARYAQAAQLEDRAAVVDVITYEDRTGL